MDKLTAIKIKYDDGTYSDEIPVSVIAGNVEWDNTHDLVDILGQVAFDTRGSLQDQISQLFTEKVSNSDMQNYITSSMPTYITNWLNTNVNPVGSAVVVDNSLSISGAAADAKKTGDEISDLKSDLNIVFSKEAKQILLDCLSHMYWTSDDGVEYIDALREALDASNRRPELPDTYEQVEYIYGNGTQWSTFDIISQIPFSVEAKVLYKGVNTNIFTGDSGTVGANSFFRFFGYNNLGSGSVADIGVRIGSSGWVYSSGYSIDTVYDIKSGVYKSGNDNISYVQVNDNERVEHILTGTLSLGYPMRLYKRDGDSWVGRGTYIYSLVCYSGGQQKIFDGIPCYRKADNVGGLYDAVTDTFYPSEGTSDYIVGPVVK